MTVNGTDQVGSMRRYSVGVHATFGSSGVALVALKAATTSTSLKRVSPFSSVPRACSAVPLKRSTKRSGVTATGIRKWLFWAYICPSMPAPQLYP
ncbi:hypothetical protein D3C85_1738150 [compost metagenome]